MIERILQAFDRVAITGGSGTGKSTLALGVTDRPVIHSDDFKHLSWSEASQACCDAVNAVAGPVLVEGAAVPRALRKGMMVDAVVMLHEPQRTQLKGQISQAKGIETVMAEWHELNPDVPIYFGA